MVNDPSKELAQRYAKALDKIIDKHGYETYMIVRAVIITKMVAELLKTQLRENIEDDAVREKLLDFVLNMFAEMVATMCTLEKVEFNTFISGLVSEVMEGKQTLQ